MRVGWWAKEGEQAMGSRAAAPSMSPAIGGHFVHVALCGEHSRSTCTVATDGKTDRVTTAHHNQFWS
jgi:hypothetical protein